MPERIPTLDSPESITLACAAAEQLGTPLDESVVAEAVETLVAPRDGGRPRIEPSEHTLVIEIDNPVFAAGGLVSRFDASKKDRHKFDSFVHGSITDSVLNIERHPFMRGVALRDHHAVRAGIYAFPVRQEPHIRSANMILADQKALMELFLKSGSVPMTPAAYIFEQTQRRELGVEMLDAAGTVNRFPQYELPPSYGDISSPRASWNEVKLVFDRSDARAYPGATIRMMRGIGPVIF